MTYIGDSAKYSLPLHIESKPLFRTPLIDPSQIVAVIPVKDDLLGLVRTLRSVFRMSPQPCYIRIVDDGSSVPITLAALQAVLGRPVQNVSVIRRNRNGGAASARNEGVKELSGWILFTDCACEHPPDLLTRFAEARSHAHDHTVAIATPIASLGIGRLSRYMTEQGNLNPPMLDGTPQAVITASVLVHGKAGAAIDWFDTRFREAGGEDLDFGMRLSSIGQIAWAPSAVVCHDFDECLVDFDNRFLRYGRGLRTLSEKWSTSLEPFAFRACSADLQDLADRQYRRMYEGYHAF